MIKLRQKNFAIRTLALAAILISGLALPVTAQANEDGEPTTIPDTPAAIWQTIDQETQEMSDMIQAGTLEDIHRLAFVVRDLIAALPERSASLPADKLAQVAANGKFIATLADRLDEAGDSGDTESAASNFKKMEAVLASIRKNYPDTTPENDTETMPKRP